MNKLLLVLLLCLAGLSVQAREIEGVKLAEQVQVAEQKLVLNGAGVRSILFFKMYVAGLYLPEKRTSAGAVMNSPGAKRVALHVVTDDAESERFLNGFRKAIQKNHNEQQLAALRERMTAFDRLFEKHPTVRRGDVIMLEWRPGMGAVVALNGVELGRIQGEDFYRALLSIWLGEKPVSDDLKQGMLGG